MQPKPNNYLSYLAIALFCIASTVTYYNYYVIPAYAADPTTFFSCEVGGGGCSIRLNTTDHITLNSTVITFMNQNVTFVQNATFINQNVLNMTFGLIAFHQSVLADCDFGVLHAVCLEDSGNNGPANYILRGGTIATPQTTEFFLLSRFDDLSNFEALRLAGTGLVYTLNIDEAGTGVLREFIIQMDGNDILTFEIDNDANFNDQDVLNLGNGGNDFLAAGNTLITTSFSGDVDGLNNAFSNLGAAGNDLGASNLLVATTFSGIVDFNSNAAINLGAAGNDLGASNTLVATTFSGQINAGVNSIIGVSFLQSQDNVFTDLAFGASGGGSWEARTSSGAAKTIRFSIKSGAGNVDVDLLNAIFDINDLGIKTVTNNTGFVFSDAVRVADIYSVNDHAKVQITGILIENDILPLPSQYNLFEDGDVVCAATEIFFFKLCDQTGDELILGVVHLLERTGIIGNHTEILEFNNITSIIVVPDYGVISYQPSLMIEGPKYIKICAPVVRGELLIAGNNGCAKGVNSLSGTTNILGYNIPNRILARDRAFAIAWEDSSGPMAAVHVRAA